MSGDTLGHLIAAWERSPEWSALAANTQAGYLTYLEVWNHARFLESMKASPVTADDLKLLNELGI